MATAAAAVVARAQRDVISYFMERNAVTAQAALHWIPDRSLNSRMVARLVRRGVLVETASDIYYLDVPAYDRWRRTARKRAAMLAGGVVLVGAILAAFA